MMSMSPSLVRASLPAWLGPCGAFGPGTAFILASHRRGDVRMNAPRGGCAAYAVLAAAPVIRSAGRAQPRVLRGRSLISSATRCSSSGEMWSRSVPLGK